MEFSKLIYSVEDRIATIAMNSPKNLNAIDGPMGTEMVKALELAQHNDDVKVVVITSSSKNFSAGGDIVRMHQMFKDGNADFMEMLRPVSELAIYLKKMPKPVVAVVNGAVAGAGFGLALACDLIIAGESTKFIQAFINVGLIPDCGGVYLLSKAVGANKAAELVMTGRPVVAQEAKTLGFVTEVYPDDALPEAAKKFAKRLSMGPRLSFKYMKELLYKAKFSDFEQYMQEEEKAQIICAKDSDALEGMTAFLEKRRPNFK